MKSRTKRSAMKDRSLQIKEALESLKATERAADFEALAGHIAKRRWPELVVTERKKDGGEDLTSFYRGTDGKRRRVACSLTGEWKKVHDDAQRQRGRGVETEVLVFITTEPVTNQTVAKWCGDFRKQFGHELEVLGQAELINELEKPENDWLCVRHLRLDPYQPDLKRLQNLLPSLRRYLQKLAEECQHVALLGIDPQLGDVTETATPELARVYVHLNTTEQRSSGGPRGPHGFRTSAEARLVAPDRTETEPLPAVGAIFDKEQDRIVFLGGPGSGKSTLFRYLAFCLARHHTEEKSDWLRDLPTGDWAASPPVPVWVELRRLAAACRDLKPAVGDSCHIWNYLKAGLEKRNFHDAIPALEAALQHGHALVLLDGLDEVPDGQRAFIREAIHSFATGGFRASRMIVTCRVKSYVPRGLQLRGFKEFTLAEFSLEQSRAFVRAWYHECARKGYQSMTEEDAAKCIPSLLKALENPRLAEMARNPMHLTAMACLHTGRAGEPLPEETAKLFDLLVNTMLFLWAKAKAKGAADAEETPDELGALLKDAGCSEKRLRGSLERLAFQAHQAAASQGASDWKPANITEDTLKLELARLDAKGQRLEWAGKVIEAIRHRAGLLQSEDGLTFQFTYRFQEFLAGGYLADKDAWERDHRKAEARGQMPPFAERAAGLFDPAGYWRNVVLWAAGIRAHVRDELGDVRDLIHELCLGPTPPDAPARRQLAFAADLVREVRLRDLLELSWGPETVADLRARLLALVESQSPAKDFPLKERAEMAAQLGWVNDPRPGVATRSRAGKKDQPDLLWTEVIQPDEFIMGGKIPNWQDEPQFKHRLQDPFRIAVHPVTVAQFELFIQDGGYARKEFWTKAGWAWREKEQRTRPDDYASAFQTPNHPRVGVTWYEAVAFCHWISAAFTPEELKLPDATWKVRLPSEAEWERAARHTDGRDFPWKEQAEPASRCNCWETELRQTTAVGIFPSGKAECGALDMAGNVWEWTLSAHEKYPYDPEDGREDLAGERARVLRGGSWSYYAGSARCAYRVRFEPGGRDRNFGFRLVASPFFALNSETSEL